MSQTVAESSEVAKQVLTASETLQQQSDDLQKAVGEFLANLQQAA